MVGTTQRSKKVYRGDSGDGGDGDGVGEVGGVGCWCKLLIGCVNRW